MKDSCCGDKKGCACCGSALSCAGRSLVAIPMFIFGVMHFISGPSMVGVLAGWPMALFFVYLSGAGLVLASVAIMLNRYARLASLLLAGEIALIILAIHVPGIVKGGDGMQMATMFALKDMVMVGAALLIASTSSDRGFSAK